MDIFHISQGPPGTGKTSFLVATLLNLVSCPSRDKCGGRVMVTAPANKAVCHLLEKFAAKLYKNCNDIELMKSSSSSSSSSSSNFGRSMEKCGKRDLFLMSSPLNKVVLLGVAEKIKEACEHEPNSGNYYICVFLLNVIIYDRKAHNNFALLLIYFNVSFMSNNHHHNNNQFRMNCCAGMNSKH
jgi:hypothetical protein